jgi:hypothetical protein
LTGQLAVDAVGRMAARPAAAQAPEERAAPQAEPDLDLDTVLKARLEPVLQYQLLRALRRTIPPTGELRDLANWLTHVVATSGATEWIDGQPSVAPLVESRLLHSKHPNARNALAGLRARWPARHHEAADTAWSFSRSLLDARAEAALHSDDLNEAATMALASIGRAN